MSFKIHIRSRHPSHNVLRQKLGRFKYRNVVRLGSTTTLNNTAERIELNSVAGIKTSANKLLMKTAFRDNGVKTAEWTTGSNSQEIIDNLKQELGPDRNMFPIVAKHIYGSRGTGNYIINSEEELDKWINNRNMSNYIFEKYYNYNKEYRLHVNSEGCFYTCRKMLKKDIDDNKKWFRNDSNSVWILEENEAFDKPNNWEEIVNESVKALNAVGLDFAAMDVRVQNNFDEKGRERSYPNFIIIESNSAPSFGEKTSERYLEEIPKMLERKTKQ